MTNAEIIVNLATMIAEQRLEISELKTEVEHLHHELIATMSEADTPQTDEIGDCNSCEYLGDLRCGMCTNGSGYKRRADTPQTDCLTCRYNSDEWDSPKCDSCSKAHSNYEPQTDCGWK